MKHEAIIINPKIPRYRFKRKRPILKVVAVPTILKPHTTTRPVPQIRFAYLAAFKTFIPNIVVSVAFSLSVRASFVFRFYSSKSPLIFLFFINLI